MDCPIRRSGTAGTQEAAFHASNQGKNSNHNSQQSGNKNGATQKSSKGGKKSKKKKSSHAKTAEEVDYVDAAWSARVLKLSGEDEPDIFESAEHMPTAATQKVVKPTDTQKCRSVSVLKPETNNNNESAVVAYDATCCVTDASAKIAQEIQPDTVLSSTLISQNVSWTIDSGASAHMTRHDNFIKVTDNAPTGRISTANGEILKVVKKGSMAVVLGNNSITMNNVLLVPDLEANLLSVSRIASAGKKVTFEGNKCVIASPDGKILAETIAENGIYKIKSEWQTCNLARGEKSQAILWHKRLGHMNPQTMLKMAKHYDLNFTSQDVEAIKTCVTCAKGKQSRLPFKVSESKTTEVLALVHSDVCGPMNRESMGGAKYFVTFIDDYSRKFFVYPMSKKDQVFEKFKAFKSFVETQTGKLIRVWRSDNGGEFVSKAFNEFIKKAGIHHQTSNVKTPQQNGVAERANRTLIEKAKCLLSEAALPNSFWGEAINASVFIINRSINASTGGIPEELWRGETIKIDNLRVFGCRVMVLNSAKSHKLDDRSIEMTFVGYDTDKKGYRCYDHAARKIVVSRDVKFHENIFRPKPDNMVTWIDRDEEENENKLPVSNEKEKAKNLPDDQRKMVLPDSEEIYEEALSEPEDVGSQVNAPRKKFQGRLEVSAASDNRNPSSAPSSTRSGNVFGVPFTFARLAILLDTEFVFKCDEKRINEDPVNHHEIKGRPDEKLWLEAMQEEINSLHKNGTWILVDLPTGKKPIKCRWIFKTKVSAAGKLEKYKARLVAKGFTQRYGIDFTETFSPVVRYSSVRLIFAIAALKKMKVHQMDVKTAFLHGDIEETLFMEQPPCFEDGTNKVCLLKKSLYGLKQAGRNWNLMLKKTLKSFGLEQSHVDQCIYFNENCTLIIAIYVDDLLIVAQSNGVLAELKTKLNNAFSMTDLGLAKSCIGIRIHQNEDGIQLDQTVYIDEVLKRFGMTDCNPAVTPAASGNTLTNATDEATEEVPYQQAVGALLFIAQATRPDIAFAVNVASRFNNSHTIVEWKFVKRIMRYLKFTQNKRLSFTFRSNYDVIAYSDSDYATNKIDRKSTTGYIVMLAGAAINWRSTKQKIITLSSTEAELVAMTAAMQDLIYFKNLMCELKYFCKFYLKVDNTSAINIAKSNIFSDRTKHIDIRFKFILENAIAQEIDVSHISTNDNVADFLTKALPRDKFDKFTTLSGLN